MIMCYAALAGLTFFLIFAYAGVTLIFPIWRKYPFTDHMSMEDSLPYFCIISIVCAAIQMVNSVLGRVISEKLQKDD